MTTLANALALACFLAACFRARWVALALAPAVALILASWTGLVDLSSASHPARWIVPLVGALGAGWAAWKATDAHRKLERKILRYPYTKTAHVESLNAETRAWQLRYGLLPGVAALLVFGSDIVDLVALHPKIWEIPGVWAITPIQIIVCVSILVVLLAPERWVVKWVK